jgi:hypothetical protein
MREKQGGIAAGAQDLGDDTMGYVGGTGQTSGNYDARSVMRQRLVYNQDLCASVSSEPLDGDPDG